MERGPFAVAFGVAILVLLPAALALAPPPSGLGSTGLVSSADGPLLYPPMMTDPSDILAPDAMSSQPPPTIQDGIGPGSALHQSGDGGGFLCTAAFLLRDPRTATYYLSTAGHCLVEDETDPAPYTGAHDPKKVMKSVEICVAGCIDNALSLGTYVELSVQGAYHPVAFAQSGGIGEDFGLIQLPHDVHDQLRPEMPQWGGPTGMSDTASGDILVHYGHGTYCCPVAGGVVSRTPADQGRAAVSLGSDGHSFQASGWITGGDSGSGIALSEADGAGILHGTSALGVITHGVEGAGTIFYGTLLEHGLDMAAQTTGLHLELVQEGDPLPAVGDPSAGPAIAIASPAPGATVRPVSGAVPIAGNATVDGAPPQDGVRVEVSIDDPQYGFESRLPVNGNGSWSATWHTGSSPVGLHTLFARLVGPDGTLAETNRTIHLAKATTTGSAGASGGAGGGSAGGSRTTAHSGTSASGESSGPSGPLHVPAPGLPGLALALACALAVAAVNRIRRR